MKPLYRNTENDQNKPQNTSIQIPQNPKITSNLPKVQSNPQFHNKNYSQPSKILSPPSSKDDFFYYETENYKNYKYKLYNIDIAEIERKRLQGKKILISDYNNPWRNQEEKKTKDFSKIIGLGESPVQRKNKSHYNNSKAGIISKINKLSMDLRIVNSKKETQLFEEKEENYEEKKEKSEFLPVLEGPQHKFQKQDPFQLLSRRLMGFIKKKKFELPNLNATSTNNNSSMQVGSEDGRNLCKKKIGGGFSLAVKVKGGHPNKEKNKSVLVDKSPLSEERKTKAMVSPSDQIIQILKSRKVKKAKVLTSELKFKSKSSYDEFTHLIKITHKSLKIEDEREKFVSIPVFKESFVVFRNNTEEINSRILLAFDINPFEENAKVLWEQFSRFKSVLITRESSILERVNFICKFFAPQPKVKYVKIEEFLGVFKSLCLKLGEENNICVTLFNLYLQNLRNLEIITDQSNQIVVDDFRQAVINNEVTINALLDLITEAFQ